MVLDGRQRKEINYEFNKFIEDALNTNDPCDDCTHWVGKI